MHLRHANGEHSPLHCLKCSCILMLHYGMDVGQYAGFDQSGPQGWLEAQKSSRRGLWGAHASCSSSECSVYVPGATRAKTMSADSAATTDACARKAKHDAEEGAEGVVLQTLPCFKPFASPLSLVLQHPGSTLAGLGTGLSESGACSASGRAAVRACSAWRTLGALEERMSRRPSVCTRSAISPTGSPSSPASARTWAHERSGGLFKQYNAARNKVTLPVQQIWLLLARVTACRSQLRQDPGARMGQILF